MGTMSRAEVFDRFGVELTRFATSMVGPFHARDVVSDAMVSAMWSKGWDRVENPRAYLYRAVLNQAKMHHRSTARRRVREREAARVGAGLVPGPDVDVWDALGRLSVSERAVVYLTYWEDLTEREVGQRLSLSERTIRRRLSSAQESLRRVLDD